MATGDCLVIISLIMLQYVRFAHIYNSILLRIGRVVILLVLLGGLIVEMNSRSVFALFFLSLFLQFEIFFHFYIAKVAAHIPLVNNTDNNMMSCTRKALDCYYPYDDSSLIIKQLLQTNQIQFMLQKMHAEAKDIPLIDFPKQDLLADAANIVKSVNGTVIMTVDLFAAYLYRIEPQAKVLFNKQLKPEEFLDIVAWARRVFTSEEFPSKLRVPFVGAGIGEFLTTGWTLETKKYTSDFSYQAFRLRPTMTGREKEFKELISGLSRPDNNNVLIVGDVGSGRENLVAGLVQASYANTIPRKLNHMKVLELMVGPLIAGAANRAELETRLQAIIEEVSHSGDIVLYIPEFQNIVGSSSYEVDLSGALYPYLQKGNVPVIATITTGNYKAYLEKSSLNEVFSLVKLEEPDKKTAMAMLLEHASMIEAKYNVILTYKAIDVAVEYADRYFLDAALPGSAANLLEDVSHKHQGVDNSKPYITGDHVIKVIEEKTHIAVATPTGAEKDLLLHFEEKLHNRVISQTDAIVAISEAMRRLRAGLVTLKRPISFLFLGPTGVGKTETAKALAELYFGGEDKMIRLDMSEYSDTEGERRLLGAAPGQGKERGELTDKVADNPFSLVLLDEFEKANPKILDLFLQVLEDGRLTDNKGRTVSFVNCLIIATSNAGAEFIREEVQKGVNLDKKFSHNLLDYLQTNHLFKPELINRFDDVIVFKPLGLPEMTAITEIMLADVSKRLQKQDIVFKYDEKLLAKIAQEGFDPQFGARPLRRYIQDNVEDILAQKKLRDEIKRGNTVLLTVAADGSIQSKIT